MVLRLTSRSPRRPCFVVTVACASSRRLDASTGARLAPPRPPHPAPNVRDDREAPLLWVRDTLDLALQQQCKIAPILAPEPVRHTQRDISLEIEQHWQRPAGCRIVQDYHFKIAARGINEIG